MKLITWNVRGLNKGYKQRKIALFIKTNKVSIIALLEHKIKFHHEGQVLKKIAPGWKCLSNSTSSPKEKI